MIDISDGDGQIMELEIGPCLVCWSLRDGLHGVHDVHDARGVHDVHDVPKLQQHDHNTQEI